MASTLLPIPHARYQSPTAPIVAVLAAVTVPIVALGSSTATIPLSSDVLQNPPSAASRLSITVGYHTVAVASHTGLVSYPPASWRTNAVRCSVNFGHGANVPDECYPTSASHLNASRHYPMLDVTAMAVEAFNAQGQQGLYVNVAVEAIDGSAFRGGNEVPTGVVFLVCWCDPIAVESIISDSIRLARVAASQLQQQRGGSGGGGFNFPIANTNQPLSASTQQQLAATTDAGDDDDIQFIGSSSNGKNAHGGAAGPVLSTSANANIQKFPVSFRCPLSYSLMSLPGKGLHCSHFSCFDISTYVRHCATVVNAWNCPICGAEVRHTDIVLSSVLEEAMLAYGSLLSADDDGCDGCYLLVDVSNASCPIVVGWEPSEEAAELMRQQEVEDEGNDYDDEFDRRRANRSSHHHRSL